jgi:hypothetical protein
MRKVIFVSLLVVLSALLVACGGAATSVPDSSGKPVNIKVDSNPSPAMMGDTELIFTIADQNGKPIEGASVDVTADHTEMSGMNMGGAATDQGNGKYSIKANFSMSGAWKLTVTVRKDSLDYKEDIEFKVQ